MAARLRDAADEHARARMPLLASLKRYVSAYEAGRHFPRDYAVLYCRVFGMTVQELFGDAAVSCQSPHATKVGAEAGVADAVNLSAWIQVTNVSDDAIAYLSEQVGAAAEGHSYEPPSVVLTEVWELHERVQAMLRGGRQRLRQSRELFRLDASLLAHVCLLLGDVRRDQAASAYGLAAITMANEAGASPAAAFSAQAQTARWRHRYLQAADLAAAGFARCPPSGLRTLLACQEANAAALAHDPRRAGAALSRADSSAGPGPDSAWSCPPPRLALYRLGVALHLGDPHEALRQAAAAQAAWEGGSPKAFGTWAHVQIAAGIAHLMLGSVDGAAEEISPVLGLPGEFRLATVIDHMAVMDALLRRRAFRCSAEATALHDQITEFTGHGAATMP